MKRPMTVLTLVLGLMLAVLVAGSASAASPKTKAKSATPTTKKSPQDQFTVINGTADAASDHVIVGSSAFPNFTKGAVDNYYSLGHSHVDNSPFAEGTASPADTGPIGQTAAAGNTQQPQYADARWPGKPDQATYGNQGGPYAAATAAKYRATADASEATNGLSGPGLGGSKTLPVPLGFDGRLRQALASWRAKWRGPLGLAPTAPSPTAGVPKAPLDVPKAPLPKAGVTTPSATVTTPVGTVTTPSATGASPAPPVTVPTPTLPSAGAASAPQSLAAFRTSKAAPSPPGSASGDGESLLSSSTLATLVPAAGKTTATKKGKGKTKTTYALVTSGESSLKRVTLGGGQIVIEGIHITASIVNDGTTPTNKVAVSIASATIGGVPVTIDQNGVHLAGQGQGVPYQQASDALNGALKQAGIQLFLVAPEIKTNTCGGQSGMGAGAGGSSSNSSSSSSSQSGNGTDSCDQSGTGTDTGCNQTGTSSGTPPGVTPPGIPTPPSSPSSDQSDTPTSSCDQTGAYGGCDQASSGTSTSTTSTTTTSGLPTSPSPGPSDGRGTSTTTPSSSCDTNGTTPTTGCGKASTKQSTTSTTSTTSAPSSTSSPSSSNFFDTTAGTGGAGEETVRATGLHVVFTQPVNQPGVPAQFVEHILGEVFLDSLATPASPLPKLGLGLSSSSCLGGRVSSGTTSAGGVSGGGLSAGGSTSAGSLGTSGSGGATFGSASQPGASSTGTSLPAAFASAMRKPLWLLLAYLVWQALVIGTGWSLWNWRKGGAS